MFKKEKSY